MGVKITSLELENIKRVKALALEPSESGLTVIGGRNGQGKTSVLDAIAWALGGDRLRPGAAPRDGSVLSSAVYMWLRTEELKGPLREGHTLPAPPEEGGAAPRALEAEARILRQLRFSGFF